VTRSTASSSASAASSASASAHETEPAGPDEPAPKREEPLWCTVSGEDDRQLVEACAPTQRECEELPGAASGCRELAADTRLYCCVVRPLVLVYTPGQERCFETRDFCDEAHQSAGVPVVTRMLRDAHLVQRTP
jgi:hypothetical protein